MEDAVRRIIEAVGKRPVLVDVGSAGEPPRVWADLLDHAEYVGFDPLQGESDSSTGPAIPGRHVLPFAVTPRSTHEVEFFATRSPYCSSTLEPDLEAVAPYLFRDLFELMSTLSVPATTLPAALETLGLECVHWLKIDTQGTDLRLILSLPEVLLGRLLAVDVEPGLFPAYVGEDVFGEVHRELTNRGFWLSRLDVRGAIRLHRANLSRIENDPERCDVGPVLESLRESPCWCEARYLRRLDSLSNLGNGDWLLLWLFAMVDEQIGYGIDIAMEFERVFQDPVTATMLLDACVDELRRKDRRSAVTKVWRRFAPLPVRRGIFRMRRAMSSYGSK